jgi:hypothetical protein
MTFIFVLSSVRLRTYDRSFSSRFANRTLGGSSSTSRRRRTSVTIRKPPIASMETVREHNFENGLHAGTLVATDDDYKTMASYHRTLPDDHGDDIRRLLQPGAHVFTGGEDNAGKNSCSDEALCPWLRIRENDPTDWRPYARGEVSTRGPSAGRRYSGRRLPGSEGSGQHIRSAARRS